MLKHVPVKNKLMAKLCAEAHGLKKNRETKLKNRNPKVERKPCMEI